MGGAPGRRKGVGHRSIRHACRRGVTTDRILIGRECHERLRRAGGQDPRRLATATSDRLDEPDPSNGSAILIRVEQISAGSGLEVGRARGSKDEVGDVARIRVAVRILEHHPDVVSRPVREEERALVIGRIAAGTIERQAGNRPAADAALVASDDLLLVEVREERRGQLRRLGLQGAADARAGVRRADAGFIAGPREILDVAVGGVRYAVDFFRAAAPVCDPQLL